MATTYEKIATTTLGSTQSSITFSSISSSYTDLRLALVAKCSAGAANMFLTFNNDSSALYSGTYIYGDGSSATSQRITGDTSFQITYSQGVPSSQPAFYEFDIFSYAGSTFKTALVGCSVDTNGAGSTQRSVHLYRSTSAINKLDLTMSSFAVGTTATLYGILKA
jgi:hypothetical protein